MRKAETIGGLMLALAMTVPAAAQAPEMPPAAQIEPAASGEGIQMVDYRPGDPQRRLGPAQIPPQGRHAMLGHRWHRQPTFAGLALRYRESLGLSTQQVDSLRKISLDARRAAIQLGADRKIAAVDLMALRQSDTVDMGKVEAKVRELEKLRADGQIATFRANEEAEAQLTAEQREKLKGLRADSWSAMRERMHQGRRDGR